MKRALKQAKHYENWIIRCRVIQENVKIIDFKLNQKRILRGHNIKNKTNVIEQNLMKRNTNFTVCESKGDEKLVCLYVRNMSHP